MQHHDWNYVSIESIDLPDMQSSMEMFTCQKP